MDQQNNGNKERYGSEGMCWPATQTLPILQLLGYLLALASAFSCEALTQYEVVGIKVSTSLTSKFSLLLAGSRALLLLYQGNLENKTWAITQGRWGRWCCVLGRCSTYALLASHFILYQPQGHIDWETLAVNSNGTWDLLWALMETSHGMPSSAVQ